MLNLLRSENVQKFSIIIFSTICVKVYIACMICVYACMLTNINIHIYIHAFHLYLQYKYISKMNLCSKISHYPIKYGKEHKVRRIHYCHN